MVATIIVLLCRLEALVNNIDITSESNNGNPGYDSEPQQIKPNLTMVSNVTDDSKIIIHTLFILV